MKGENFGVESFATGNKDGAHMGGHGDHVEHDGLHLHDDHRAGPPAIHMGDGMMHATHHSHHGPHHHHAKHHHHAPKGTRPHHVGGAHMHHGGKRGK